MMKQKLYLDTSVPSRYYDDKRPEGKRVTRLWWKNDMSKYAVVLSAVTVGEIQKTEDLDIRDKLFELITGIKALPVTPECEKLADLYIENEIVKEKLRNDALHIAVASVNRVDILVSWNFSHIVNLKTRTKVNAINLLNDYREINIVSPYELEGGKYV